MKYPLENRKIDANKQKVLTEFNNHINVQFVHENSILLIKIEKLENLLYKITKY